MHIGINARPLVDGKTRGWSRYTLNLIESLLHKGHQVTLYSDAELAHEHEPHIRGARQVIAPAWNYLWWEQVWLRWRLNKDRVDVYHCPIHFGVPVFCPIPSVLTLHDAIDFNSESGLDLKNRLLFYLSRVSADMITTVSEFSKMDLVYSLSIKPQKIRVIYESANAIFDFRNKVGREVVKGVDLQQKFFLYIGGLDRRKNIQLLINAFLKIDANDFHLVIAGGQPEERDQLRAKINMLKQQERIHLLGYISDKEAKALYQNAFCFVYPSLYEGLGLQVVEAMACDCAVLVSKDTSLAEVLGNDAFTFDATDENSIAALMQKFIADENFRNQAMVHIRNRRQFFDWENQTARLIEIYREISASDR